MSKQLFMIAAIAVQPFLIHLAKAEAEKVKPRSLLFQGAVEELRKNPHAADLPECSSKQAKAGELCISGPATTPNAKSTSAIPVADASQRS